MKAVKIINEFFGRKPGQSLSDFSKEIKELSQAEKDEICTLAAKELGVTYEKA